jgi:hypothetical protein
MEKSLNADPYYVKTIKANGVLTMSKITSGIVLFSLLMALSLGVAFAESEVAETGNVDANNTTEENNTSVTMPLNNTTIVMPANNSSEIK